jgi:hypothetical protein
MNVKTFLDTTYSALSESSGIHQGNWVKYFTGRRAMNVSTLKRVAEKLQMTPAELIEAIDARGKAMLEKQVSKDLVQKQ